MMTLELTDKFNHHVVKNYLLLSETVQETGPHLPERLAFAMRRARMVEALAASARRGEERRGRERYGRAAATRPRDRRRSEQTAGAEIDKSKLLSSERTSRLANFSEKGREQRAQDVRGRRLHAGGGHSVS